MKYYEICLGNQSEQTATQYQVNSDLHSVTGWKWFDKDLCSQWNSSRDKALHLAESLSWHRAFLDLKLCTHWIKRVKRVKRVSFLRFFKDTLLQSQVSWFFIPGLLAIWWTGMVQPAAKVSVCQWPCVADRGRLVVQRESCPCETQETWRILAWPRLGTTGALMSLN